jgi:hypothetical protein
VQEIIKRGNIFLANGKKSPSGFVPIPFRLLGKILLPVSLVFIVSGGLSYFVSEIPRVLLYVGAGFLLISIYLRFYGRDD